MKRIYFVLYSIELFVLGVLMALCFSCATTHESEPLIRTEIKTYVPDLTFPNFPNIGEVEVTEDGRYIVSRDYIIALAEYRIEIEAIERYYGRVQSLMQE